MARYVVAVSGGVDSIELLVMLVNGSLPNSNRQISLANLIVAHFDHGIRTDSADDAQFVATLAKKYGLTFETAREELGVGASEELARTQRYAFLRQVAKKYDAKIMTAHHSNDVIETVAINLTRGTGWRGLAVLDSPDIERPLLNLTKAEIILYAKQQKLEWREDSTNTDTAYLRNDLRNKLTMLDNDSRELIGLYRKRQVALKRYIDDETNKLIGASPYSRHLFITCNETAALELLRAVFVHETGASPAIKQRRQALHAIKVLPAGKSLTVGDGIAICFTKTNFVVQPRPKVVS